MLDMLSCAGPPAPVVNIELTIIKLSVGRNIGLPGTPKPMAAFDVRQDKISVDY